MVYIMMKTERLKLIEEMLIKQGTVEVANLCRIFGVAEMTIRRDLSELVNREIAVRSHGGATLAVHGVYSESPYELRIKHHLKEKEAIARLALPYVVDGEKIFFDSSTTAHCLARLINNEQNFLVVTDTLPTALELNSRSNVKVVTLGGELKKSTCSNIGMFAEQMLQSMHFNPAFIGLSRISEDGLLSTTSTSELSIKRTVIEHSQKVVVLVDSSKLLDHDFLEIGNLSQVSTLITDSNMPTSFLSFARKLGVEVLVAEV